MALAPLLRTEHSASGGTNYQLPIMGEARLWRSRYPTRNPATQGTNYGREPGIPVRVHRTYYRSHV